jgi:hypothetical protein
MSCCCWKSANGAGTGLSKYVVYGQGAAKGAAELEVVSEE